MIANGHASGTVTLPGPVMRFVRLSATTKGQHVGFVLSRDGAFYHGAAMIREPDGRWQSAGQGASSEPGRYDIDVVTDAPVTLRVKIEGMRGRVEVRLRTPLRGATAVRRGFGPPGLGGAGDAIDFATAGPTFVLHAVDYYYSSERVEGFCVNPRDVPCLPGNIDRNGAEGYGSLMWSDHEWSADGPARATYQAVDVRPDPQYHGVHTLIAIPYG